MPNLDKIKQAARGATGGGYTLHRDGVLCVGIGPVKFGAHGSFYDENSGLDLHYIATMDPATTLALVEALEAMAGEIVIYNDCLSGYGVKTAADILAEHGIETGE
ncbi:MAG: hypothetical protein GY851_07545 [bacterium]|nr:hypothetical protein [bacterium]